MPRSTNVTPPKYRKHKASGQAVVTMNHRDLYLGPHGSLASRAEYDRLIAEWLANGRHPASFSGSSPGIKIVDLIDRYLDFAKTYYRKSDGTPTGEITTLKSALRPLFYLYAHTPAAEFGPLALKAVRQRMLGQDWCRRHVNAQLSRIKSMFRWAVENELVPASIHHGLLSVRGLIQGRCEVREGRKVRPVLEQHVVAIRHHVAPQVWAMIELQLVTGMRPGEVVLMRDSELDRSGKIWTYLPPFHKTAHHGHERRIFIGPRGQEIIQPFLKSDPSAFLFSPIEAEELRRLILSQRRRTPLSCGNRPGTNRKNDAKRKPENHYSVDSYRRAIERGCLKAFPPPEHLCPRPRETHATWKARLKMAEIKEWRDWNRSHRWHPHQLRHNAATRLRKEFGIEAARLILGHRSASVTEVYAEMDAAKAIQIVQTVG